MTREELIAKQQLDIEHLKIRLGWAREDKREIVMILVCCGGPLNDNYLQYTKDQRAPLHEILRLAEAGDHEDLGDETRSV